MEHNYIHAGMSVIIMRGSYLHVVEYQGRFREGEVHTFFRT